MTNREKAINWALAAVAAVSLAVSVTLAAAGDPGLATLEMATACFCIAVSLWLMAGPRASL